MKRQMVGVALASAAVLLLGACGASTSGSAQAASEGTAASSQQTTGSSGTDSEGGNTDAAGDIGSSGSSADAGSDEAVGSMEGSGTSSGSGSNPSGGTGSPSGASTPSVGPTTTLSGTMDSATKEWFGAMCTGATTVLHAIGPIMTATMAGQSGHSSGQEPDYAAITKKLTGALSNAGASLADTADKLGSLPPPSIDQGDEAAAEVVEQLTEISDAMTSVAKKLGQADVDDADSFDAAMAQLDDLDSSLSGEGQGASMLDSADLSPELKAEVMKLPACQPLAQLAGLAGGGSGGASVPTTN